MNFMQTTTGNQYTEIKRAVTWASFGSLKTSHVGVFIFQDYFGESIVEQHALLGRV